MAGNLNINYGTAGQALTITLASLASGAARQSTAVDNTTTLFTDALVTVRVKTGVGTPALQKSFNVYAYGSTDGGTIYTEGAGGTDAAITLISPTNLILIGTVSAPTASTTYTGGPFSVAAAFGGSLPSRWGIVVENQEGQTADATAGNHSATYQGILGSYT